MVACTTVRLVKNILKCWWKWFGLEVQYPRRLLSLTPISPVCPVAWVLYPVRMYQNHLETFSKWMHSAISPERSTHACLQPMACEALRGTQEEKGMHNLKGLPGGFCPFIYLGTSA